MSGAEPIIAAEAAAAIGATEAAAATAAAAEAAAATAAAAEAATAMQAAQTAATAANTASPFLTGGIEQAAAEGMRNFATQSMAGVPVPGAIPGSTTSISTDKKTPSHSLVRVANDSSRTSLSPR